MIFVVNVLPFTIAYVFYLLTPPFIHESSQGSHPSSYIRIGYSDVVPNFIFKKRETNKTGRYYPNFTIIITITFIESTSDEFPIELLLLFVSGISSMELSVTSDESILR